MIGSEHRSCRARESQLFSAVCPGNARNKSIEFRDAPRPRGVADRNRRLNVMVPNLLHLRNHSEVRTVRRPGESVNVVEFRTPPGAIRSVDTNYIQFGDIILRNVPHILQQVLRPWIANQCEFCPILRNDRSADAIRQCDDLCRLTTCQGTDAEPAPMLHFEYSVEGPTLFGTT